ncbi:MAG: hypothetical protein KDA59_24180, partial [Planctomycetales bacterium]|nr:hypothetical protein [Planctomycetales bacterium]
MEEWEFSLDTAPGLWNEYTAVPLFLSSMNKGAPRALHFQVDHRPDARQRGGEIMILRWQPDGNIGLERLDIETQRIQTVGVPFTGSSRPFYGFHIAVSNDATYVASQTPGFTIIRDNSCETITQADGAPSDDVYRLAWHKDRLYIAYANAFASYDPVTKRFQLIASSVSIAPKNPLDGRGSFFITEMISDQRNDCLWLSVQDNIAPRSRNGFWKYQTGNGVFQHIAPGDVRPHVTPASVDDGIVLRDEVKQAWVRVAPGDHRLAMLDSYPIWERPRDGRFPSYRFLTINNRIVTAYGQMLLADGEIFDARPRQVWYWLERVNSGFITHYDDKMNVLWYVAPKRDVASDSLGALRKRLTDQANGPARQRQQQLQLLALQKRLSTPGPEGLEAARSIIAACFPLPAFRPSLGSSDQQQYNTIFDAAFRRLDSEAEYTALYHRLLRTAEERQDPELLAYWSMTVLSGFRSLDDMQKGEVGPRLLAVLGNPRTADLVGARIRSLRQSLEQTMRERGLLEYPRFSMENAPGPWRRYAEHAIPIEKSPDNLQLHQVLFDTREEAKQRDEQLVLVWARPFRHLSVERLSIRGGKPRKLSSNVRGYPVPFHQINVAIGDDGTVYLGSDEPGVAAIHHDGTIEMIDAPAAATKPQVQAIAWLDGKLYAAFENTIAAYSPDLQRFELLASAVAANRSNPLNDEVG